MRNRYVIIASAAGALALATANLKAQGTELAVPTNSPLKSEQWDRGLTEVAPARIPSASMNLATGELIGLPVQNESGESLGKVRGLIVNMEAHAVPVAIVGHGGKFGFGETRVAVPLTNLKWSRESRQLILAATKEQLEAASTTPTGTWVAFAGEDWLKDVDRFYGQPATTSQARFERQEASGLSEGREPVRSPSETEGAPGLLDPQIGTGTDATKLVAKPSEADLMAKINNLIRHDVGPEAEAIQATFKDGVVTLTGKIPTDAQKRVLENQIKALPGVNRVQNDLTTGSE